MNTTHLAIAADYHKEHDPTRALVLTHVAHIIRPGVLVALAHYRIVIMTATKLIPGGQV